MAVDFTDPEIKEKALKARKEASKARNGFVNKTGRARDRRMSGDVRNYKDSIASFCSECITGYGDDTGGAGSVFRAVEACTADKCHLWPWRNGKAHPEDVIAER